MFITHGNEKNEIFTNLIETIFAISRVYSMWRNVIVQRNINEYDSGCICILMGEMQQIMYKHILEILIF